jgi:hypothetical protein
MTKDTVLASEVGSYAFCARACWYSRHDYPSNNPARLSAGRLQHERLAGHARSANKLQHAGRLMLLMAALLSILYAVQSVVG